MAGNRRPPGPDVPLSSLAFGPDGRTLWVASPDDDSLVEVGRTTLQVRRRIHVAGQPDEVAHLGSRLVVTRAQAPAVTVVDLAAATPTAASVALPCGWGRSVVAVPAGTGPLAHDTAFVTCPTDDRVAVVDLTTGRAVAALEVAAAHGHRQRRAVVDGVAAVGGTMHTWALADLARALGSPLAAVGVPRSLDVAAVSHRVWTDGTARPPRSAPSTWDLPAPWACTRSLTTSGRCRRRTWPTARAATAGRCTAGPDRAALAARCGPLRQLHRPGSGVQRARGGCRGAPRGPGLGGGPVQPLGLGRAVRKGSPAGTSTMVAAFPVGAGARGRLAVDGRTAYVDVGFDHAVDRLELPRRPPDRQRPLPATPPALVARRATTDLHLSPLAEAGRRMFTDATDPHLTPDGVVTCASCHPAGGGDDGLSWRIQTATIPRKLRRTPTCGRSPHTRRCTGTAPSTRGRAGDADGAGALGGDGLLLDPTPIVRYLHELAPPPGAPTPTATARAAVAHGSTLFHSPTVGYTSCHTGGSGTDGKRHDVLAPRCPPMPASRW